MKLVLTGDNHYQYGQPLARLDNFMETQKRKTAWLKELIVNLSAIVLDAGDLSNSARIYYSNEYLNFIKDTIPKRFGIAGNHDLVDNTMTKFSNSLISNIVNQGLFTLIPETGIEIAPGIVAYGFSYGVPLKHIKVDINKFNIMLFHGMVVEGDAIHAKEFNAKNLLIEYAEFDLILTAHSHKTFVVKHSGRTLVNPGSIFRLTAGQVDHKPCVFVFDTESRELKQEFIPIEPDVVSREHIEVAEAQEAMLDEFTEKIKMGQIISVDFEENIRCAINISDIIPEVESEVMSIVGASV